MDFSSTPINITFAAGEVTRTVDVMVACDKLMEGAETFDISLVLLTSTSLVTLGRSASTGEIVDTTGNLCIDNIEVIVEL